jgi:hypothetical protein
MTMRTCQAHDLLEVTERTISPEGYLIAPGRLARTGVQLYRAFELGLDQELGIDPMRVIRLYRPPEEVFDAASMASFEGKPITIDHPAEPVTAQNWKELAVGDARGIARSGQFMTGTLVVKYAGAIDEVQSGKSELSNGYVFDLDMTPGTDPDGNPYDGIQRNIRGNHIALVDAARCGSACRIADSLPPQPNGVATMPDAKRKVIVDGIPFEVDDTAAAAIDKLMQQRDTAVAERDEAKKNAASSIVLVIGDSPTTFTADALTRLLAAKDTEIERLRKDVMTPEARDAMVADWAKTLNEARRLVPTISTDGKTCVAIRREVLTTLTGTDGTAKAIAEAVLGGQDAQSADESLVRAAFNAVAASIKAGDAAAADADRRVADALLGNHAGDGADNELSGPEKLAARMAAGWSDQ